MHVNPTRRNGVPAPQLHVRSRGRAAAVRPYRSPGRSPMPLFFAVGKPIRHKETS